MATLIRVAIANDYDIVVAGVAAALAPFKDRVVVVELVAGASVSDSCDVVLYDTFGQPQGDGIDVAAVVDPDKAGEARIVVFSWHDAPPLVEAALERGAAGYVSKRVSAEELVQAIERVHRGESVIPPRPSTPSPALETPVLELGDWPGQSHGLTSRESEVLALICQGMSNQEIASRAYLGINTVKTYVRGAYRKIGATSRSQAVLWGVAHGFTPDHTRRSPDS